MKNRTFCENEFSTHNKKVNSSKTFSWLFDRWTTYTLHETTYFSLLFQIHLSLVHKLFNFSLTIPYSCNRTVGCNRTIQGSSQSYKVNSAKSTNHRPWWMRNNGFHEISQWALFMLIADQVSWFHNNRWDSIFFGKK